MTTERYPHVFEPIRLGPVELPNRFYIPPHGVGLTARGPHGSQVPSGDAVHYFGERAANGVGLIVHSTTLQPLIDLPCARFDGSIPSFKAVADRVHSHGSKIFAQLWYNWSQLLPWEPGGPVGPSFGPSALQRWNHYSVLTEISVPQIRVLQGVFATCARNLAAAGYDGVMIHINHGVLLEQFLSAYFNRRNDGYGGDLEGRLRFPMETLEAVREAVGDKLAVGIRLTSAQLLMNPDGTETGGWTAEDAKEILRRLIDRQLLDFADLDMSVEPMHAHFMATPYLVPPLRTAGFVAQVREAARDIPVLCAGGRITSVAQAEKLIADGVADVVGAVRELISEPELLTHARQGREHMSRIYLGTEYGPEFGDPMNPATGREGRWGLTSFTLARHPSKVVVVGGGPAGLEAARVAARKGHTVVLLERRPRVGGQLNLWASLPDREILGKGVNWFEAQLPYLGVEVRCGVESDADMVLAERPDAVIVATGSRYAQTGEGGFAQAPVAGWDHDFVYTPERILEDGVRPTGKVLILDEEGINTGVGIAELLAAAGAEVEIVTRHLVPPPAQWLPRESKFIIPRLKRLGVKTTTASYVKEIRAREVIVFDVDTLAEEVKQVDAVVLATMRRPVSDLANGLEGQVSQLFVIGDALSPRGFASATYEGHRFARLIGEEGAPRTMTDAIFAPPEVHPSRGPAEALLAQAAT